MKIEVKNYKPRLIDDKIEKYLRIFGAVLIEGPKYCGKTWAAYKHSKSNILLYDGTERGINNLTLAKNSPEIILEGEKPRLIDEWQVATNLWDVIRYDVDFSGKNGQYILTGSSTPNRDGIFHSGAGRFGRLKLRTMSLFESGDSSGAISLKKLCDGELKEHIFDDVDIRKLIKLVIRGGWPKNLNYSSEDSLEANKSYIENILLDDISRVDNLRRDYNKMKLLLRSLSRNESSTVSNSTLKKDIKEIDREDIDVDTVSEYLNIFDRLNLIDNDKPFSTNVRSGIRLKQSEKRHFCDPSLACAILNLTPEKLLNDLNTFGFLFEALVERDLKIYADSFNASCYHYQDYNNNEIDCVIELESGEWCAFEIKLGANKIDEAANNLVKIKNQIERDNGKVPKVLCVICGLTNKSYIREDGVFVIPITALRN